MGKTETRERAEQAVSGIVKMFESGELPEAIARTVIHRQHSDAPSAKWSLGNQIIMFFQGTADARGFRQWEKAGRTVKKGARAFYILAPLTKKIEDKESGEEKVIITGFKSVPVFALENTEGDEVVVPDYQPPTLPPLMDTAKRFGLDINWAPFTGFAYGAYGPGSKQVTLMTHDEVVWFHELAHAAHDRVEGVKGGQDRKQEIVAETVAAVLAVLYGFEGHLPHSYEYIADYAGENPARAIMGVLSTVQKVLDEILQ